MKTDIPLSEAIALGRVLLKPKAQFLIDGEGAGCALGMALTAIGAEIEFPAFLEEPERIWPWLRKRDISPCPCRLYLSYSELIAHLFDHHVMRKMSLNPWTLDRLIDWVRRVEPKEEVKKESKQKEPTMRVFMTT